MPEGPNQLAFPRPFFEEPWPAHSREAARALWNWHIALLREPAHGPVSDEVAFRLAEDVEGGSHLPWVPRDVANAAYGACSRHGLPRGWLADQVRVAPRMWGSVRIIDQADLESVMLNRAVAHARLLARLAEAAHSWQIPYVDEFARGLFLVGRMMELPADVRADRIFIPLSDLEQAGVSVEQLLEGRVDEPMRKLLWKQVIRARDALAHGAPLAGEVSPRFARAMKRWWMAGVEMLNEVERRDYDLWSRPPALSFFGRLQVRFQARFGRTTFRKR